MAGTAVLVFDIENESTPTDQSESLIRQHCVLHLCRLIYKYCNDSSFSSLRLLFSVICEEERERDRIEMTNMDSWFHNNEKSTV